MVRRQQGVNGYTSTLNGPVTDSTTSWSVASATGLPSEGDFFLTCEDEIVLVTHISGTTLTVIRGQAGSSASAHSSGVDVLSIVIAEEFYNRANDMAQRKALPYGKCTASDGTILTSADFTLVNTGTGTAVADGNDGTIIFSAKDMTGDDLTGAIRAFGTANDWRVTVHIECTGYEGASPPDHLAFYQRQQSGGTMSGLTLKPQRGSADPTNPGKLTYGTRVTYLTTESEAVVHGACGRKDFWARVTLEWDVVATTDRLTWEYSWDGVHWWTMAIQELALATTQIGIWLTNQTGTIANMRSTILSWYEEAL